MRTRFEYRVYFEDGTHLDQWMPTENKYRNISTIFEKHRESRITKVQWVNIETDEPQIEIPIDVGQKPIIRYKNQIKINPISGKQEGPIIRNYILGKHWIETYYPDGWSFKKHPDFKPIKVNKQILVLMNDKGQIIATDGWREDYAMLEPIRFMEDELIEDEQT